MKTRLKIFTTVLSVLACCAFLPTMQAQLPPEIPGNPDGCYPAFTTAEGCNALHQLFGGIGNTAIGWYSNFLAGDASFNTSVGAGTLALDSGIGAGQNTAVGTAAMILNLSGNQNVAVGTNALVNNATGSFNNGVGAFVLYNNDSSGAGLANDNNAFGDSALFSNIDGAGNCAFGDGALFSSVITSDNTAIGRLALASNDSSGNGLATNNTAVGSQALLNNIDGDYITALGANAGTDPDIVRNNIYIGDMGFAGDTNVIAIGGIAASGTDYTATFIGGIAGATVSTDAAVVYIDTDGHLGTVLMDANGKPAAPRVRRGNAAQPQAMLNRKVEELQATVAQQQKQIEALTAGLQKVSAQLEVSKPAPQVVANKP